MFSSSLPSGIVRRDSRQLLKLVTHSATSRVLSPLSNSDSAKSHRHSFFRIAADSTLPCKFPPPCYCFLSHSCCWFQSESFCCKSLLLPYSNQWGEHSRNVLPPSHSLPHLLMCLWTAFRFFIPSTDWFALNIMN